MSGYGLSRGYIDNPIQHGGGSVQLTEKVSFAEMEKGAVLLTYAMETFKRSFSAGDTLEDIIVAHKTTLVLKIQFSEE